MKKNLLLTCSLLNTILLSAQQYHFGAAAGLLTAYAPMEFAGSTAFEPKVQMRPGAAIGLTASYSPRSSGRWQVNSGLGLNIYTVGQEFTGQNSTIMIKNTFMVLDIPLLAQYKLNHRFAVAAGGNLQMPVYGRQYSKVIVYNGGIYETTNNARSLTRSLWPALQAACYYDISNQWGLKLYYTYMPDGFYKRPNNNSQYFNPVHTVGLNICYRK